MIARKDESTSMISFDVDIADVRTLFVLPNIWPFVRSSSRCQMLRTARLGRPGHASIYLSRFWHALCHVYICVRLAVLQKGPNISKASCHMLLLLLARCQSKSDYCPLNISYLASAAARPPRPTAAPRQVEKHRQGV